MITKEWFDKLNEKEKEIQSMKDTLIEKAKEVLTWENENTGGKYDINDPIVHYYFTVETDENSIYLHVESSWRYGGHDENTYTVPLYKILSDDWKEKAVEEYKACQEKEKAEEEAKKAAKEREEYERLKAKFENEKVVEPKSDNERFKELVLFLAELADEHYEYDDIILDFEDKIEEAGGKAWFGAAKSDWSLGIEFTRYRYKDPEFYAEYYDGMQAPFTVCEWNDDFDKLETLMKETSEELYEKYQKHLKTNE